MLPALIGPSPGRSKGRGGRSVANNRMMPQDCPQRTPTLNKGPGCAAFGAIKPRLVGLAKARRSLGDRDLRTRRDTIGSKSVTTLGPRLAIPVKAKSWAADNGNASAPKAAVTTMGTRPHPIGPMECPICAGASIRRGELCRISAVGIVFVPPGRSSKDVGLRCSLTVSPSQLCDKGSAIGKGRWMESEMPAAMNWGRGSNTDCWQRAMLPHDYPQRGSFHQCSDEKEQMKAIDDQSR
jgi:hypothetical protein